MTQADRVLSTPPTNASATTQFSGAQCPTYPNCSGGCGLGCTKEHAPVDKGRRGFLSQAAVVAAGGAALGMALPLPAAAGSAESEPDPIYAVIANHRRASEVYDRCVRRSSALVRELPAERCRTSITAFEKDVIDTDDERWIASERALDAAGDEMHAAARALAGEPAQSIAGALALLNYYVEMVGNADHGDPYQFPDWFELKDREVEFKFALIESVAVRLTALTKRLSPEQLAGGAA